MSEPTHPLRKTDRDQSAVLALAQKTHTPIDVVKNLYDEELAELRSNSAVKGFIDVIAGRRVKERLRRAPSRVARRVDPAVIS